MAYLRQKKNGKWQVLYKLNGKQKSGGTFESKREANRKLKEVEAEVTLGIVKDESNIKFKEYAEMVFKTHDRKASFQTKKNRRYYLDILYDLIGNWKIKDIKAVNLKKLFVKLSENNSDQVLLKYKQILNITLDSAAEEDIIEYNPMVKVKFAISQKNIKEVKSIDLDTFKKYLKYAKNQKKYYFGLLLMFYTGMRIGEVLALRLDDFDFKNNVINVTKNRQRHGEIGEPKKGRSRKVPIHEKIAELYYEVTLYHKNNKFLFEDDYKDNNLFIAHEDGRYVSYSAFREYLRRLDERVNIKLRPHQLRHTFATFMRGMEIKDIQKIGGWKDTDTLVNIYQDHDGFKDETIQNLDERFKIF